MSTEKFAVITGCGRGGIGHALAESFRTRNFTVITTLLPHETRDHLEDPQIHVFNLDVTDEANVESFALLVQKLTGGKLDVLVNNAGIAYTMPAVDTEIAQVEKMFGVNVFGAMRMVRHFHRQLIAARGLIVNIGSIAGICPFVYGASYNASKAALVHYGNTLRVEMLPFGVRVVNVISGEVHTNVLKNDYNRTLPPDSVFQPMEAEFQAHVRRTPNAITPAEYAEGVVRMAVRRSQPAYFWFGAAVFPIRMLDAWFPRRIWDFVFWRYFGLGKLQAAVAEGKA